MSRSVGSTSSAASGLFASSTAAAVPQLRPTSQTQTGTSSSSFSVSASSSSSSSSAAAAAGRSAPFTQFTRTSLSASALLQRVRDAEKTKAFSWLIQTRLRVPDRSFRLLYSWQQDGRSAASFHDLCDNQVIIESMLSLVTNCHLPHKF